MKIRVYLPLTISFQLAIYTPVHALMEAGIPPFRVYVMLLKDYDDVIIQLNTLNQNSEIVEYHPVHAHMEAGISGIPPLRVYVTQKLR